jgi:hypothetical protein
VHPHALIEVEKVIKEGRAIDESAINQIIKFDTRSSSTIPEAFTAARDAKTAHTIKLLACICIDCLPFALVDSLRFREFSQDIGPYKPPSARTLVRHLALLHRAVDRIVTQRLSQLEFLSVAVDE